MLPNIYCATKPMNISKRGFTKNILIIVVILAIVFLSQQAYFRPIIKNLYQQGNKYLIEAQNWFKTNIYSKVSGEVEKRGEEAKKEINKEKNNILQNIWGKLKNYFAEKFSKTFGTKVE